ncbi:MAG TPA: EAL domain-containing protein [Pyrinomonadaceae bacterium]|nr:EAL domain-containing protein [Pyrinomonadaceae bacterium]
MKRARSDILIIDDDEQIRSLLREVLFVEFNCETVGSAEEALTLLEAKTFNLVISDIQMGGISGLDLVPRILSRSPETVVVMASGEQGIESAIEAMRVGAFDYIIKPLELRHVQAVVHRALSHQKLLADKRLYENHLEELVQKRTAEVERLAYYDSLTNLPNRVLFADRTQQALNNATHSRETVGLLLLSLDRFKKINDTLGHETGDLLLQEVAIRLCEGVRAGDTIARLGGDEFAFLVNHVQGTEDLAELAHEILSALNPSIVLHAHELYVNASIGIGVFPADGPDFANIMKNAGAALHRAKRKGGSCYEFYAAEMNAEALKRLALENDLRRAVSNQEFVTYYQPVIDFPSGKIVGSEALVRWQHPKLGLLAPAEFIDIAEDTGLILGIADQVLFAAATQTRLWQDQGFGALRSAVNISARQFQDKNFVDRVVGILAAAHLDPQSLELEITETSIMENAEVAMSVLSEIRKMGVRIAIDDFGIGYSSLSYLKRLPIDTVKLDRSFVTGASTDPKDAALVMAIITLAHNLNLKVIAEGVETIGQHDFLRLLKCDEGQGYLFGRPMPADLFKSNMLSGAKRKQDVVLTRSANEVEQARV